MSTIEPVGYGSLATHGALLILILFIGDCHAGDRMLGSHYWVYGASKCQLDGTSYLTSIVTSAHHGSEGADVVVVLAHILACLVLIIRLFPLFLRFEV